MSVELKSRLAAAENAYHLLMIGQSAVEFRDQNGETVRYTTANAGRLQAYIAYLKRELGMTTPSSTGPARGWF